MTLNFPNTIITISWKKEEKKYFITTCQGFCLQSCDNMQLRTLFISVLKHLTPAKWFSYISNTKFFYKFMNYTLVSAFQSRFVSFQWGLVFDNCVDLAVLDFVGYKVRPINAGDIALIRCIFSLCFQVHDVWRGIKVREKNNVSPDRRGSTWTPFVSVIWFDITENSLGLSII